MIKRLKILTPFMGFLLLFLLIGCAGENWYKEGVKEEEKDSDLSFCEQFAHQQVKKEEASNPPSVSGNTDVSGGSQSETSTSLSLNLENYQNKNRYADLVDQCMTGNGYQKK